MLNYQVFIKNSKHLDSFIHSESVDLILSGPPYWNEVVYSQHEDQLSAINSYPEFLQAISAVWQACAKTLKPGGVAAVWLHDFLRPAFGGHNYFAFHNDLARSFPAELQLRNIWIWDRYLTRDKGPLPQHGAIGIRYMYVLILQKIGQHPNNQKLIQRSLEKSYWQPVWHKKTSAKILGSETLFKLGFYLAKPFGSSLQKLKSKAGNSGLVKDDHAFLNYETECPEEIVERLMRDYSQAGDVILDPFLGSGTVMKIAKQMERSCLGMEINEAALPAIKKKVNLPDLQVIS